MPETFNIYCDESCHLESDHQKFMVLGAIWTPQNSAHALFEASRKLKVKHKLSSKFELKWGKVSAGQQDYYEDVLRWFWETQELCFRGLIAPKDKLDHSAFGQTHDDWYYKMYFDLLKVIIDPKQRYNIYLDIKDTRDQKKVEKLHNVLSHTESETASLVSSDNRQLKSARSLSVRLRGRQREDSAVPLASRIRISSDS